MHRALLQQQDEEIVIEPATPGLPGQAPVLPPGQEETTIVVTPPGTQEPAVTPQPQVPTQQPPVQQPVVPKGPYCIPRGANGLTVLAAGDSITQGSVPSKMLNHPYTIEMEKILESTLATEVRAVDAGGCGMGVSGAR